MAIAFDYGASGRFFRKVYRVKNGRIDRVWEMLDRDDDVEAKQLHDLVGALYAEDELGAVVRGHIIVEAALNDLLCQLSPCPEHLDGSHREFFRNIQLAMILGMPEDLAGPLRALGKIRNSFAHDIHFTLTPECVNGLTGALSNRLMATVRDQFSRLALEHSDFRSAGAFEELSLRHRFQMLATTLWFALKEASWEAQLAKKKMQLAVLRNEAYGAGTLRPIIAPE